MSELGETISKILSAEAITVYLDDFALVNDHGLLDVVHPRIQMWVTPGVMSRMNAANSADPRQRAMRAKFIEAVESGRIHYMPVDMTGLNITPGVVGPAEDILAPAVGRKPGADSKISIVVSYGDEIKRQGVALGVVVLDPSEFRQLLTTLNQREEAEAADERRQQAFARRKKILALWVQAPLGCGIAWCGIVLWRNFTQVLEYARSFQIPSVAIVPAATALACILGGLLYHCRGRWKFAYGFAEVLFGCYSVNTSLSLNADSGRLSVDEIRLAGGVYVIVRGLDNIGKWCEGTSWDPFWRKFSREPSKK